MLLPSADDHGIGEWQRFEGDGYVFMGSRFPPDSDGLALYATPDVCVVVWGASGEIVEFIRDSMVWAAQHLGRYPTYSRDSRALLKRIFRTSMKRLAHEYSHAKYASASGCICVFRRATGWVLPYGNAVALISREKRLPVILAGDAFNSKDTSRSVLSVQPVPFRFQMGDRLGIADPVTARTLVSSDMAYSTIQAMVTEFVKSTSLIHGAPAILGVYERTDKINP